MTLSKKPRWMHSSEEPRGCSSHAQTKEGGRKRETERDRDRVIETDIWRETERQRHRSINKLLLGGRGGSLRQGGPYDGTDRPLF